MKKIFLFMSAFFGFSCASVPPIPTDLSTISPQVEYIAPDDEGVLSAARPTWVIFFSKPMDVGSLSEESLVLSQGEIHLSDYSNAAELNKSIEKGKVSQVSLEFETRQEGKVVLITPQEDLEEGMYTIIVTSRFLSVDHLPLNQNPGGSAMPFVAHYQVVSDRLESSPNGSNSLSSIAGGSGNSQGNQGGVSGNHSGYAGAAGARSINPTLGSAGMSGSAIPPSYDDLPIFIPPTAQGGQAGTAGIAGQSSEPTSPPVSPQAAGVSGETEHPSETAGSGGVGGESAVGLSTHVVINEVFYDAVGSDTDGVLFVELYGPPHQSLSHYQIHFVNGDDGHVYDSMTLPDNAQTSSEGFYVIADARTGLPTVSNIPHPDLIDNFDPQNGPDAVQLVNAEGQILDAVGYGETIAPTAENNLRSFEGTPTLDVVNGHSLERRSPGIDTDNNQSDFADREIPTPGR